MPTCAETRQAGGDARHAPRALHTLVQRDGSSSRFARSPRGMAKGSSGTHGARGDAGALPASSNEGSSPWHSAASGTVFAQDHGRGSILAGRPGPTAPPALLLCSEVLGHTSEESGGSKQQTESARERATQIPGIMSPEEGDGGLCLRREPCFYWRGLKGL